MGWGLEGGRTRNYAAHTVQRPFLRMAPPPSAMQRLKLGPPACDTKMQQARWQSQVGEPISQVRGATVWLHCGGWPRPSSCWAASNAEAPCSYSHIFYENGPASCRSYLEEGWLVEHGWGVGRGPMTRATGLSSRRPRPRGASRATPRPPPLQPRLLAPGLPRPAVAPVAACAPLASPRLRRLWRLRPGDGASSGSGGCSGVSAVDFAMKCTTVSRTATLP